MTQGEGPAGLDSVRNATPAPEAMSLEAAVPEPLRAFFREHPRVALAYSGGVDSACLLACGLACGAQVVPITVTTQFQFPFEALDADAAAHRLHVQAVHLHRDILEVPQVADNPPDRCYWCKRELLGAVREAAAQRGCDVVADGTNASDDPARRPGFKALAELGIRSPLREAGLTKGDVRALSSRLGLPTADKPSYSCRATALPHGTPLTLEALEAVSVQDWLDR